MDVPAVVTTSLRAAIVSRCDKKPSIPSNIDVLSGRHAPFEVGAVLALDSFRCCRFPNPDLRAAPGFPATRANQFAVANKAPISIALKSLKMSMLSSFLPYKNSIFEC